TGSSGCSFALKSPGALRPPASLLSDLSPAEVLLSPFDEPILVDHPDPTVLPRGKKGIGVARIVGQSRLAALLYAIQAFPEPVRLALRLVRNHGQPSKHLGRLHQCDEHPRLLCRRGSNSSKNSPTAWAWTVLDSGPPRGGYPLWRKRTKRAW